MANKFLSYDGLLYFWQKLKTYFVKQEEGKMLSSNDYTAEDRAKLAGLTNYELPKASSDTLGGVKVGAGLNISEEGTLSATGGGVADSVDWANVQDKPETFPPEAHSHTASEITDLEETLSAKGYQTAGDVESAISSKGYQTAEDVQRAVAQAGRLKRQKVDSLPSAAEADADTIYMVPIPDAQGMNKYTEWMVLDGAWEQTGSGDVDLSGYVKAEDLQSVSNEEIDGIVAA